MNRIIATHLLAALFLSCATIAHGADQTDRPNILWISLEDITPMMGCYGNEYARTPILDSLASEGIGRLPIPLGSSFQ